MRLLVEVEGRLLDEFIGGLRNVKRHLLSLWGNLGSRGGCRDWRCLGRLGAPGFWGRGLLDPRPHHAFKRPLRLCHASSLLSAVSPRPTARASPRPPSHAG